MLNVLETGAIRAPSLRDLPAPPEGKTGWPWTVESNSRTASPPFANWPKISIVTPSYNQGHFIEETIRSVLLQGYPNLEFRIADGGSKDNTLEIISKYSPWLTSWTSGPDRGQVDALNRGLSATSGEIVTWLNSDDLLLPDALFTVAKLHGLDPRADLISGARIQRSAETRTEMAWVPWLDKWPLIAVGFAIFPQEATFFSRRIWDAVGPMDETLNFGFDGAFFADAVARAQRIIFTATPLAVMHAHRAQKSLSSDAARIACERRLDTLYRSRVPWFCRPFTRLSFTRFAVVGDAALRCLAYGRARKKFEVGAYDWATDSWSLAEF
jgi:glycosyltransferase involved in cell wall biosynthesis